MVAELNQELYLGHVPHVTVKARSEGQPVLLLGVLLKSLSALLVTGPEKLLTTNVRLAGAVAANKKQKNSKLLSLLVLITEPVYGWLKKGMQEIEEEPQAISMSTCS
jgi:hypothetical protein